MRPPAYECAGCLLNFAFFEDDMHAIYLRQKLERSQQAAEEGKITSQEEMEKRYLNDAR